MDIAAEKNNKSNGTEPALNQQAGQEISQDVIGYTMTRECFESIVSILKDQPWEKVYKIMPELVGSKQITRTPE